MNFQRAPEDMSHDSYIWDLGEKQRGPYGQGKLREQGRGQRKHESTRKGGWSSRQGAVAGRDQGPGEQGGGLSSLPWWGSGVAKPS